MGFRIVRPMGRSDVYDAPNLFPRSNEYGGRMLRKYVADEMIRMAADKTLCVTDLLNQRQEITDLAGQIILGQELEDNRQVLGRPVPKELSNYQVRVKSINGEPVRWVRDMVRGEPIVKGKAVGYNPDDDSKFQAYRVVEEEVHTDSHDVTLDLPEAWLCLKQSGKWCRRAMRQDVQAKEWKCEEVRPETKTTDAQKTDKRAKSSFAPADSSR